MVLVGLVVLALAVAAAWAVGRRRREDLDAALRSLAAVAEGDLTKPVPTGLAGPAGQIALHTAAVVARLRQVLTEADQVVAELTEGWQAMNDVSWEMMDRSESTVAESAAAAGAASDVSGSMRFIASRSEQTTASIREVAAHATQASVFAKSGAEQISAAESRVGDLQVAFRRVEDVMGLIAGITRQTNLLALNATIEAARAGEHGRGFAVVAGEVKQLAGQTEQAAENVTTTVRDIEAGSQRAATSMANLIGVMGHVRDTQQAIAIAVDGQTATTQEIAGSAAEAAARATALVTSVQSLTDAVRLGSYAGARGRVIAADVGKLTDDLRTLVNGYRFEPVPLTRNADPAEGGVLTANGVTTVRNFVQGTGLNQFAYEGRWGFARGAVEADGGNAHSSMPGDRCSLRFTGRRIVFYGVAAPNHGKAAIWVDDGPEHIIDQYAAERRQGVRDWESPELPPGEHTLHLRVLGESNPLSRYVWINVDRVEITD
jgi:methyl-accepting chemotaxis protein